MAERSGLTPNKETPYGSLQSLMTRALRRYGDFNPGTIDGATYSMFIDFANEVVEEVRTHPLFTGDQIDYYTHQEETRPIPDLLMVTGLMFKYAIQQSSEKAKTYGPNYYKIMNTTLYDRQFGNARPIINKFDGENDYDSRTERRAAAVVAARYRSGIE